MAQKSTLTYLPDELKSLALDKLDNHNFTQEEVTSWVNQQLQALWQEALEQLSAKEATILEKKLSDPKQKQAEIVKWLKKRLQNKNIDIPDLKILKVSKSAINRFWLQIEKQRLGVKQAREAASHIISGMNERDDDLGAAVTELIKTISFELIINNSKDLSVEDRLEMMNKLSNITKRIAEASRYDSERIRKEEEIRRSERLEATKEINQASIEAGLSEETADRLMELLGVSSDK